MKVQVSFRYHTNGVIPPRCRKPRTVFSDGVTEVDVPEVTGAQAPVALRVPDHTYDRDNQYVESVAEWRWHDGRLWLPYLPWSRQEEPSTPGSKYFPAEQTAHSLGEQPNDAAASVAVQKEFDRYLIIDDVVYREVHGEPVYEVYTFGLGGNHGGTSLSIGSYPDDRFSPGRAFRADQLELAIEQAVRVALGRGDDQSVERIRATKPIEVLIPAVLRHDPQRDAAVERANEEIKVALPRHAWQDLAARIAEDPALQFARSTILASIS